MLKTKILLVDDDPNIRQLVNLYLEKEGFEVSMAGRGDDAMKLFRADPPNLILLDLMLPGMDGFAVCAKVREQSNTPILIVSAKTEKNDKRTGLLLGADDYIEKPYDVDILLAKIRGIFRRRYAQDELVDGELRLNKAARSLTKDGRPIELTGKEFDLLCLLMENKGKALSKEYLFSQVWGSDSFSELQTLTVHIKWLRQKIEDDPKKPAKILTVWGVGYQYI
jgi:DNA-binding response OmpR family regulator